jgi:hypothetical protein
MNGTVIVW